MVELIARYKAVSSAESLTLDLTCSGRSFMYARKRIGPSTGELPALEFSQSRKISHYCKEWPLQSSANTDQVKFLKLRDVPN